MFVKSCITYTIIFCDKSILSTSSTTFHVFLHFCFPLRQIFHFLFQLKGVPQIHRYRNPVSWSQREIFPSSGLIVCQGQSIGPSLFFHLRFFNFFGEFFLKIHSIRLTFCHCQLLTRKLRICRMIECQQTANNAQQQNNYTITADNNIEYRSETMSHRH